MSRAVNAGDIRLNQRGELTGIEMMLFTTSVIMYGAGFTAGWTGQLCVLSNADNDRHCTIFFIKKKGLYLPRCGQVKDMGIEGFFVHESAPS